MSKRFEELDWAKTPMGEISLRRRRDPALDVEVYEARLDDDFLMSSLFTVAEIALAELGLARLQGQDLDVVVGGLGLGYTAQAVLADPRVRSLHVLEALPEVIAWHQRELLPDTAGLTSDRRCHLVTADFFALVRSGSGFGVAVPDPCHAVLVDIDHTPSHVLHPSHADLYTPPGLARVADRLLPGGVFALWSDDPPDPAFVSVLDHVFATTAAHVVPFANPLTGGQSTNTVYVATTTPTTTA